MRFTESEFERAHKEHKDDFAAVRKEIEAFRKQVEADNHGLTERQLVLLRVILKWAEWIAEGFKPIKALLGLVVFCAVAYSSGKTLIEGVFK
jgi:hypothetical protein